MVASCIEGNCAGLSKCRIISFIAWFTVLRRMLHTAEDGNDNLPRLRIQNRDCGTDSNVGHVSRGLVPVADSEAEGSYSKKQTVGFTSCS